MNNWSNERFLFWLFSGPLGAWHIAWRCVDCGRGYGIAEEGKGAPRSGVHQWLCGVCGAPADRLVKWVGRTNKWMDYWEWLSESKLPTDIAPKATQDAFQRAVAETVERELPKRLDAEFEARVRAAVEVELAVRQGFRKAATTLP